MAEEYPAGEKRRNPWYTLGSVDKLPPKVDLGDPYQEERFSTGFPSGRMEGLEKKPGEHRLPPSRSYGAGARLRIDPTHKGARLGHLAGKVPAESHSYGDYMRAQYAGYPGGVDAMRNEAFANMQNLSQSQRDLAVAPAYWDDWRLNRKTPVFKNRELQSIGYTGPYTKNKMSAGKAYVDFVQPKGYPRFSAIELNTPRRWSTDYDPRPTQTFPEELIHSAQFKEGVPRDMNYITDPLEVGAKLTQAKHDYVRKNWPRDTPPDYEARSFNEEDAAKILAPDYRKKKSLMTPQGQKFIEENKKDLIQFLMSTAANDRAVPGLFTGHRPQRV